MRDTFPASLAMAEQALLRLGMSASATAGALSLFRRHDEERLESQYALRDDEAKMIQTTRAAAEQLKELFESDPAARGAGARIRFPTFPVAETSMGISMYQASAPRFVNTLGNLSAVLDKAQAHAEAKGVDPLVLTACRIYPDMFPLSRQVQIATDTAKGALARLAGVEVPKYEDTERSFAELKARIAKTIAFLEGFKPAQIDGSEDKGLSIKLGRNEVNFKGMQYLLGFALPNFYFHVTTAYDILRHNGVELGKRDYIGNP